MDKNIDQRICLKFCIAKGISCAESLKILQKAYGESTLSKTRAYEWTINSDVYWRQLKKLNAAVNEKRPELVNRKGLIFDNDNTTSHTSLVTRQKLLRLG